MSQSLVVVLASLFLIVPHHFVEPQNQPPPYEDPVAYEVYDTVLPSDSLYKLDHPLVIHTETETYKMCLKPDKDSEALIGPAISNFIEKNKKVWSLQKQFHIDKSYVLFSNDELQGRRKIDHPEQYVNYLGFVPYVGLSAVGFNPDKTVAVVYEMYFCGGLCAGGQFIVLQKKDGKWRRFDMHGLVPNCNWNS